MRGSVVQRRSRAHKLSVSCFSSCSCSPFDAMLKAEDLRSGPEVQVAQELKPDAKAGLLREWPDESTQKQLKRLLKDLRASGSKDSLNVLLNFANKHTDACHLICEALVKDLESTNPKVRLHMLFGLSYLMRRADNSALYSEYFGTSLVKRFGGVIRQQGENENTAMTVDQLDKVTRLCDRWKSDDILSPMTMDTLYEEIKMASKTIDIRKLKDVLVHDLPPLPPLSEYRKKDVCDLRHYLVRDNGISTSQLQEHKLLDKFYANLQRTEASLQASSSAPSLALLASLSGASEEIANRAIGRLWNNPMHLAYNSQEVPKPTPDFWQTLLEEDLDRDLPVAQDAKFSRLLHIFVRLRMRRGFPKLLSEPDQACLLDKAKRVVRETTGLRVDDVPEDADDKYHSEWSTKRTNGTLHFFYDLCARLTVDTPRERNVARWLAGKTFAIWEEREEADLEPQVCEVSILDENWTEAPKVNPAPLQRPSRERYPGPHHHHRHHHRRRPHDHPRPNSGSDLAGPSKAERLMDQWASWEGRVVYLEGLPADCTDKLVKEFFKGLETCDIIFYRHSHREGGTSVEAHVDFVTRMDPQVVMAFDQTKIRGQGWDRTDNTPCVVRVRPSDRRRMYKNGSIGPGSSQGSFLARKDKRKRQGDFDPSQCYRGQSQHNHNHNRSNHRGLPPPGSRRPSYAKGGSFDRDRYGRVNAPAGPGNYKKPRHSQSGGWSTGHQQRRYR